MVSCCFYLNINENNVKNSNTACIAWIIILILKISSVLDLFLPEACGELLLIWFGYDLMSKSELGIKPRTCHSRVLYSHSSRASCSELMMSLVND